MSNTRAHRCHRFTPMLPHRTTHLVPNNTYLIPPRLSALVSSSTNHTNACIQCWTCEQDALWNPTGPSIQHPSGLGRPISTYHLMTYRSCPNPSYNHLTSNAKLRAWRHWMDIHMCSCYSHNTPLHPKCCNLSLSSVFHMSYFFQDGKPVLPHSAQIVSII